MLQYLLFFTLGILAGTFTGLIPGIHINLISAVLVSSAMGVFSNTNKIFLIIFITAMSITHTFLDFIPSIFLGCPDTDTELSILPGHKLLKKGLGFQAIILTAYGSISAIIILLLITLPCILFIEKIYPLIEILIPYILILTSFFLISLEKYKFKSLGIFLLTGLLGLSVLNLNLEQPLLPMLTGLFGASMLIISIKNKILIPEQIIEFPRINLTKPLLGSFFAAPLCSFLPGLGSGQASIIGSQISRIKEFQHRHFLILLGATNTLVMGFSFLSLYTISKTRTGTAAAIKQLSYTLTSTTLIIILTTIIFAGIISFFLTIFLAKIFSTNIHKLNYTLISILTLIILTTIIFIFSGITGFIVFITSTFTGIYAIHSKVRRTNMMGCLLVPTILLYLFYLQ
jgi:putative membrane protein